MIDRIRRAISSMGDAVSAQLEPTATSLGKAFGVADWAVSLFSEEVRARRVFKHMCSQTAG